MLCVCWGLLRLLRGGISRRLAKCATRTACVHSGALRAPLCIQGDVMARLAGRREIGVKFPMKAASVDPKSTQLTPLTTCYSYCGWTNRCTIQLKVKPKLRQTCAEKRDTPAAQNWPRRGVIFNQSCKDLSIHSCVAYLRPTLCKN